MSFEVSIKIAPVTVKAPKLEEALNNLAAAMQGFPGTLPAPDMRITMNQGSDTTSPAVQPETVPATVPVQADSQNIPGQGLSASGAVPQYQTPQGVPGAVLVQTDSQSVSGQVSTAVPQYQVPSATAVPQYQAPQGVPGQSPAYMVSGAVPVQTNPQNIPGQISTAVPQYQVPSASSAVPVQNATQGSADALREKIIQAGARLVESGHMQQMIALLQKYGVQAVNQLRPEQYEAVAAELQGMGAQI